MNNKTITKSLFLAAAVAAITMAYFGWEQSFSQNALKDYGWLLVIYLSCASLGFAFLAADSGNRNEEFTFIKWPMPWGYLYTWMFVSFLLVNSFNVYQSYLPHIVATGMVVFGAYVMCWNYFTTKWKRTASIATISAAILFFLSAWLFGISTTAWGELAVTSVALGVSWVIINEKLKK